MELARRAGLLAVLVMACSSGGGSPPPPSGFTVSGRIQAQAATDADGDTADRAAPLVHNDTPSTAQLLPSVVTVGGWASRAADQFDAYRTTLAAGQVVTLGIADWSAGGPTDLDLCIFTTATPPQAVDCSAGVGPTETLTVPATGDYLVVVNAYEGASSYDLALTLGPASAAGPQALHSAAEFVPGEVIVRFTDGVLPAGVADALEARAASVGLVPLAGAARQDMLLGLGTGAARARAFAALGIAGTRRDLAAEVVDPVGAAKADTIAVVKGLRRRADVARADLNYIHRPTLEPNDTHYPLQWHYPLINLPAAWDISTGSDTVVVAVVDTGVFLAHPDLNANLVPGYDFILDPARARDGDGIDANPDDPGDSTTPGNSSYHGTHVAGTIAAESNSGATGGGVAGVSWTTKIMPLRALGVGGGTSFDINNAVRWAAGLVTTPAAPAQRADVVNLSLGCQGCFSSTDEAAYADARAAGVVIVAAAGNEASGMAGYPASYAGVISVSAVDMLGARAPYSNFGPNVDIAAPGGDTTQDLDHNGFGDGVLSTWKDDTAVGSPVAYKFMQGTSMATPHVAGVVALMKAVWTSAACPTFTPAGVDSILSRGGMTVDAGAAGRDDLYGHGLVDALKTVQSAETCGTTLPTILGVSPGRLDFGLGTAPLTLVLSKNGPGVLPPASATDDAPWLTVTGPGGDGLGTWTATVDRTGLVDGTYSAHLTFTAGTSTVVVPVVIQVGGIAPGPGDVGHLHIVLTDANQMPVVTTAANAAGGEYPFSLAGVPAGTYYLFAWTDLDGDAGVCDAGEACGAYPNALPAPLEVSGDRSDIVFTVGFDSAFGGASAPAGGSAPWPGSKEDRP